MNKFILSTILIGFQFFQSSANAATEVARVNDRVITLEQVNELIAANARNGIATSKKAAVEELIKHEAGVQEARKIKLDQDPNTVERINNVLFFSLIEKKLGSEFDKITLSDAEAKNWYDRNPEIRTSHIFIALPQEATAEEEQRAAARLNQLAAEIKAGKISFAEAAQKNSEDPTAALGGDLDYRTKDRLDPNFYRAALKLGKPGDTSGPVRSAFGLHLIRLTGKHSWTEVDRVRVKNIIISEKRQAIVDRYLNGLRQNAKVTLNAKALN
jgi:parvulin-like peptidyl-prolyl isomerase